jgi:signal transduction histidine kinase
VSFRLKLLAAVSGAVVAAVTVVAWTVVVTTRREFQRLEADRTGALVEQFRREFQRRGQEVSRRVEGIAGAEGTLRIAIDPDPAPYVREAVSLAAAHGLDFLELVASDGTIVSSAQWPARFGYKNEWVIQPVDWKQQPPFLQREEVPDGPALALLAVRFVPAGDRKLYVIGGLRLGDAFLASLTLPAGMRARLYEAGQSPPPPANDESLHTTPLVGRHNDRLAVLAVTNSRRELLGLLRFIRRTALVVGGVGVLLGVLLSSWAAARVSRPVEQLAQGARAVAAGAWNTRVEVQSTDEIGALAEAFNSMTRELLEQRERLVQAERVAAWRELARRLAHELKNPLFPLQITIENLQRAREQTPAEFDEVFRESTATLLAELANLKTIVARFSDFAKMPAPQLETVQVNEVVRRVLKLFEAQLTGAGVEVSASLDPSVAPIQADPEQLERALQNLVLNALDAMPQGGTLAVRTSRQQGGAAVEVADSGAGLTPEECERLFTPYYTTKRHGTGLGLAIVQSVVADHHGRISVASEPGRGATFRIELPKSHA